jgi:hypothetical protein
MPLTSVVTGEPHAVWYVSELALSFGKRTRRPVPEEIEFDIGNCVIVIDQRLE